MPDKRPQQVSIGNVRLTKNDYRYVARVVRLYFTVERAEKVSYVRCADFLNNFSAFTGWTADRIRQTNITRRIFQFHYDRMK